MADLRKAPLPHAARTIGTMTLAPIRSDDAGVALIDVSGAGALDLVGVGPIAAADVGGTVTRVAGLRVSIDWARAPERVRIGADRFSADYLWEWLCDRAERL